MVWRQAHDPVSRDREVQNRLRLDRVQFSRRPVAEGLVYVALDAVIDVEPELFSQVANVKAGLDSRVRSVIPA